MSREKDGGVLSFLEFAETLVKQAGEGALKYYGRGNPRVRFDDELVTTADLAIRDVMRTAIADQYPEHRLLGEGPNHKSYRHGEQGFQWIACPVDGTANFQAGIPVWGISLALFENFWPILGVFYMPVTGDLYKALAGRKAKLMVNNTPVKVEPEVIANNESVLLTYSRFHTEFRSSFPGKIRNLGSTAAHLCYVASGRAEASLHKYVYIWHLAAGQILLEAAGGEMRYLDGRQFHLNDYLDSQKIDEPLLAAPITGHSLITQYLEPI